MSGETLEVEVNELMKGLQDIQKDIEEFSAGGEIPGDRFKDVMAVSLNSPNYLSCYYIDAICLDTVNRNSLLKLMRR